MIRLPHRLPGYGVVGLLVVLMAEALLFARVEPVPTFFTPIAWTGYILFADALVKALTGSSLLTTRRSEFAFMALWSVPAWVVFELYNLHLRNWVYVGLPEFLPLRLFGYAWAFATIFPGVLETAELIAALGLVRSVPVVPWRVDGSVQRRWLIGGALAVVLPLLVPSQIAAYLFAPVWIGFIFLCDPLTYGLGGQTLLGDLERGEVGRFYRLLLAGMVCGLLWEFWNFWAGARWYYTVPYPLDFGPRYFEMPLLGFLGFLPFAAECFCLHHLAWTAWQRWARDRLARWWHAPLVDSQS